MLSRKKTSIIATLSQKSVILKHAQNLFIRLNQLVYLQIESEIENDVY